MTNPDASDNKLRLLPHVDVLFVLHVGVLGVAIGEAGLNEQAVLCVKPGRQDGGSPDFVVHVVRNVQRIGSAARHVRVAVANDGKQEARIEIGAVGVVRHVRIAFYRFDRLEIGRRREHHVVLEFGEVGGGGVLEAHDDLIPKGGVQLFHHALVDGAQIHVRVYANVGDAEGHSAQTAAAPTRREV